MKNSCRHNFHVISLLINVSFSLISWQLPQKLSAQVVPDGSLPTRVTSSDNRNFTITDGVQVGGNLFHSFRSFSIPTNGAAVFNNSVDIQNIISRVTGGDISRINGLLQTNGTANLFLLNPQGIIFGPNASLNLGGSFFASSAETLLLADGSMFSATNLQPPLLSMSVPIGLQLGTNPGNIINQSQATNGENLITGLQVQPGKTLALVGGGITFNNGAAIAPGARIELGGLSGAGIVGINVDGSLKFPATTVENLVPRADIAISNNSEINVRGDTGGNIAVYGRNIAISTQSILRVGINSESGFVGSVTGDLVLNATDNVRIANDSIVSNAILQNGIGKSGNVDITTGSLIVTDGAVLSANTFGEGDAGAIIINARDRIFFDTARGFSDVDGNGVGSSDGIRMNARSLVLRNDARIGTTTYAKGNAGDVSVNVVEDITLDNGSFLFSGVDDGIGNSGNVSVNGRSLSLTNGSRIVASTDGQGNAGNVTVNIAENILIDGENNIAFSAIFSSVGEGEDTKGNGGIIQIRTGTLTASNGGSIVANTSGEGNAGSINIQASDRVLLTGESQNFFRDSLERPSGARSNVREGGIGNGGMVTIETPFLEMRKGARISASTLGQGNAGTIRLNSDRILIDNSDVLSTVGIAGVGNGGNIFITTSSLFVENGGRIQTDTLGIEGNAGNIFVEARDRIALDGRNDLKIRSGISSTVAPATLGNGGNINVFTGSLSLTNGAILNVNTAGVGSAGRININARDRVEFDGTTADGAPSTAVSRVLGTVGEVNTSGGITITAGSLHLTNGAQLNVSSDEGDAAGDLMVTADEIRLDHQSSMSAETALFSDITGTPLDRVSPRGNIFLRSQNLTLRRGSSLTTNARGQSIGGNIMIDTDVLVALENSDISANAEESIGGQVIINAQGIFGTQGRDRATPLSDITATSALGTQFNGVVEINTPDIDPSSGLVALPDNFVDVSQLIARGCREYQGSQFIITGRGGLPPSPDSPLTSDLMEANWVILPAQRSDRETSESPSIPVERVPGSPLVEAKGWVMGNHGEVILTAGISSGMVPGSRCR